MICGRDRFGKSESVRQSIADRNDTIYYQAVESTAQNQLKQFVDTATAQFLSLRNVRRDWEAPFEALGGEGALVVIDEFPFLIEEDESLPSRIQHVWDTQLQESVNRGGFLWFNIDYCPVVGPKFHSGQDRYSAVLMRHYKPLACDRMFDLLLY